MFRLIFILSILFALCLPSTASAQSLYGNRLASKDGKRLLPVASLHLTSTERDHIGRGSVQAWDITAPQGTPIFPIEDGVVEYAGCNNSGGYGCWTLIRHDSGIKTIMGHMINGSITVKAGQRVSQWDVVGQVGWTGMTSFGPHVHLEIHRPEGGRYNISDFWDIGQMHYQKLGNAQGKEIITEIGVAGSVANQQPATQPAAATRLDAIKAALLQAGPNVVATAALGLFGALCLVWWLGGLYERVAAVALGTSAVVVGVALWLMMPIIPAQANQQASIVGSNATWKAAYSFMRRWEGARCVHDPVRTFKGITNGTYNAWRRDQGIGPGDVCRDLTEQQAEAIYYQRYWVASGAGRLSPATAIAHFDHAVNAGVGAANGILAQCADNANCYINGRLADYQTKSNCLQYCQAWFNRVNDLVKFLQRGSDND